MARPARLNKSPTRPEYDQQRMQELLQHAWLLDDRELDSMGVGKGDEEKIFSLLGQMPRQRALIRTTYDEVDNPLKHLLHVLRKPENFFLTAKLLFNITLLPFQLVILRELWFRPFPMLIGSRGLSKSFLLAFYIMLRLMVQQGVKVVVVGAAFRQAKVVFEYCEMIWANAPVLRDACSGGKGRNNREQGPRRDIDRCEVIIGESIAIFLPLGDGKKIRGQRANIIVCEEFASTPPDIYETVVAGFASTTQDPVGGVQEQAKQRLLQRLGMWKETDAVQVGSTGNQSIISGTAYYSFNWFAKYWNRYKGIIESRGNPHKLRELQENASTGDDRDLPNYKDYSIIRIPVDLLPPGFMDSKHISRARMTITKAIFEMEYGAVFSADSDGFYKRSLIESCVAGNADNDIPFKFSARLKGEYNRKHVIAVDPAAQSDNFAIVVLALHENHRRVVYCWTTRKKQHEKLLKLGLVKESNFWAFCARKIRELLRSFPSTVKIAVDAQGGGLSVQEALHDEDKLEVGEVPIWPVIDPDPRKRKDSDGKKGLHILEMIEFADGKWVSEANHGLKKDFHDKAILFPYLDPALLGLSIEDDKANNRVYDTLEDATMEIEALKDELASIRHEETATGRERWDTPRVKTGTGITKEGRLRKDRYSALLMANMIARQIARSEPQQEYESVGGWKGSARGKSEGPLYVFDGSWAQQEGGCDDFGKVVRR